MTDPSDDSRQPLLDAVGALRSAEQLLLQQSRQSSDPATLVQINTEYAHLDSFLSQILHTLALDDEDDFDSAVASLKTQSAAVAADAQGINKVVSDAATAGKIAGFVAQAAAAIARV